MNNPKQLQEKEDKSLVWSQPQGWRVVIVIDDLWNVMSKPKTPSHLTWAFGLREIWSQVSQWEDTRAIGFFRLPDAAAQFDNLINSIQNFKNATVDQGCVCYILVDVYFGNAETPIGPKLVEKLLDWVSATDKVAFLSLSGTPDPEDFPAEIPNKIYQLPFFEKGAIKACVDRDGFLPEELLEWLDFQEHSLDRLWRYSRNWFKNDEDATLMKHTACLVGNYFSTSKAYKIGSAKEYKDNIESALNITFPETWWQNGKSVEHLHNSLRCLCGNTFCSHGGNSRISVGAVYLIALMACRKTWPQNPLTCLTKDVNLSNLPELDQPIFPHQNGDQEEQFARFLYKFFFCLFNVRDGKIEPQITKLTFDRYGKKLEIKLKWSAKDRLVHKLSESLNTPVGSFCENTTGAIIKLGKHLEQQIQVTDEGFKICQNIYMTDNVITFQNNLV